MVTSQVVMKQTSIPNTRQIDIGHSWVFMRFSGRIVKLLSKWGIQMSNRPNVGNNRYTRVPTRFQSLKTGNKKENC